MKSEKKIFLEMLDHAEIRYSDRKYDVTPDDMKEDETVIFITQGEGPNNKGYTGFFCEFHFDKDENLKAVATWE